MRLLRPSRAASLLLAALVLAPALGAQPDVPTTVRTESGSRTAEATMRGPRLPDRALSISSDNVRRLDRALVRYRTSYARLSRNDRVRLHEAFEELVPGERLSRYPLNESQARAVAWLALADDRGGWNGGGRDDDRDDDRPRSCSANVDRISRDAGWIHQAITPLRRSSSASPSHAEALRTLEAIEERARAIAVSASRCTCTDARDRASDLLDMARAATQKHRESFVSPWMSIGDERLERMQALAREVERAALGCSR